jgi:hypothetical protein
MLKPAYRYLRGYGLDPGFSTRLDTAGINEVVYRIEYEDLNPGPVGEYIEVLDFDPASNCWYAPVNLGEEIVSSQHGLRPSEGNPQFHQQFVYAVAMKTIGHFEKGLGRKIVWHPRGVEPADYVHRLRIHPHAIRDANAYYDPDKKALLFGYFAAADQTQGANYPGGLVFTCLSPDIVAHETTHAILDSIHHLYMEDTNPDVAAFHEGFADIIALLQRFTFGELVEHQLDQTGGRLDRYSVLGELATQFGEALEGNRGALRSMIGRWVSKTKWVPLEPNPSDYINNIEAHDRGAVLVATIFDAFQRVYSYRTRDLLRIATNGTGVLPRGSISRDLVHRLAGEASTIAGHLLHICIRALDYCPPIDITFGDYFRALITADLDIAPEDENGYRVALIEAFRARGIFPDRVNVLSIDSLRWAKPELLKQEQEALHSLAEGIKPSILGLAEASDRADIFRISCEVKEQLPRLLRRKAKTYAHDTWEYYLSGLGLTSLPVSRLFGENSHKVRFIRNGKRDSGYVPPIEVQTIRPAFRVGREGRQIEQVLVTLTQEVMADIGTDGVPFEMAFRGGCTLIFDFAGHNEVQYVVRKSIRSFSRFERQRDYMHGETYATALSKSTYAEDTRDRYLHFNLLHRH